MCWNMPICRPLHALRRAGVESGALRSEQKVHLFAVWKLQENTHMYTCIEIYLHDYTIIYIYIYVPMRQAGRAG